MFIDQSGNTSDIERPLNEYGRKCRMVKMLLLFSGAVTSRARAAQKMAAERLERGPSP